LPGNCSRPRRRSRDSQFSPRGPLVLPQRTQSRDPNPRFHALPCNSGLRRRALFGTRHVRHQRLDDRFEKEALAQAFGVAPMAFTEIPKAETYIMQGEVLPLDGPQAGAVDELDHARTHRHRLLAQKPRVSTSGGVMYLASAREFPVSKTMTGWVMRLKPGAMHEPHWHPNPNEWLYVLKGQTRVTLFASDKRMAVAELSSGDCAYVPRGSGHSVRNVGSTECEIIGMLDSGTYHESSLSDWVAKRPPHLLANNLGVPEGALVTSRKQRLVIAAAA